MKVSTLYLSNVIFQWLNFDYIFAPLVYCHPTFHHLASHNCDCSFLSWTIISNLFTLNLLRILLFFTSKCITLGSLIFSDYLLHLSIYQDTSYEVINIIRSSFDNNREKAWHVSFLLYTHLTCMTIWIISG